MRLAIAVLCGIGAVLGARGVSGQGVGGLPDRVAGYQQLSASANPAPDSQTRWFAKGTTKVAVVLDSLDGAPAAALRRAADEFVKIFIAEQQSGAIESFRVAFNSSDTVRTTGKLVRGWHVAVVVKRGDALTLNLFYVYAVRSHLIREASVIPAEEFQTTDVPVFARELVREYVPGTRASRGS